MDKILIVEDDVSIGELERDYLEISGYEVHVELSGLMGLKKALENDYNLVILDLMLPGMDGFEICKEIRKVKDIPILLVSAKKEDIDKIRGLGLGADDYITKPFSPSELVARAKAHISRYNRLTQKNTQSENVIEIKGLRIEVEARRIFVNENEIILTSKEFDILYHLATNPNKVFSKDRIFESIWGYDSLGEIATVTVHIRKIREKIESDPSNPEFIETIWGVGYRFKG
ncbi:response regulator transcription factor [Clostridium grantii]|uniref:Stage 0 sporulation protein A homolog n=1 Tax=Clostridium grantii DSM 8605 TaxID=1121316 RepID=A0A1M5WLT5_9CLOT|nr:response regulator transcription factor [Clostridium grantii]SHH88476.1 DNA-binding response regulator, OmpR family, contains REC and winged-helix (wHTH) domain [Clostridium grantii DSM 8605]